MPVPVTPSRSGCVTAGHLSWALTASWECAAKLEQGHGGSRGSPESGATVLASTAQDEAGPGGGRCPVFPASGASRLIPRPRALCAGLLPSCSDSGDLQPSRDASSSLPQSKRGWAPARSFLNISWGRSTWVSLAGTSWPAPGDASPLEVLPSPVPSPGGSASLPEAVPG